MQLFYSEHIADKFVLTTEESKHLVKVLRKRVGDEVHFTNGTGGLFTCRVAIDNPKGALVEVVNSEEFEDKRPDLTLAVAPTKSMDRFEWMVEKACEIGVKTIIPILCENAERDRIKLDRLHRITLAALKQSLQVHRTLVGPMTSLTQFVEQAEGTKIIAHLPENQAGKTIHQCYLASSPVTILIGPEGDFSGKELNAAINNGFEQVVLGTNRLRTETAAVVACTLVNQIYHAKNIS